MDDDLQKRKRGLQKRKKKALGREESALRLVTGGRPHE